MKFTYEQVLDATKHQDDKIGRLLTVVAFLTAGALALANLGSGKKISAIFSIPPVHLPLATIFLTFFLLTIFITVILLITSFATPLRLPGMEPKKERDSIPLSGNRNTSQIYFYEIAKVSLENWKNKWDESKENLEKQRFESLVRETHNLSVRTTFKYDRTTEAIAVFSVALLFFGLAVSFACLATVSNSIGDSSDPAHISLMGRLLLMLALSIYACVHLVSRIRYNFQSFDENYPKSTSKLTRSKIKSDRVFAVIFPVTIAANTLLTAEWPGKVVSTAIISTLCTLAMASLILRSWQKPKSDEEKRIESQPDKVSRILWSTLRIFAAVFSLLSLAASSIVAIWLEYYGIQLLGSISAVCILLLLGALNPTLTMHRHLNEYKEKLKRKEREEILRKKTVQEPRTHE